MNSALKHSLFALALCPGLLPGAHAAETLYNGIALPSPWPPQLDGRLIKSHQAIPVPYLAAPPKVIPVDLGRQLFVDDFLIETTTLTRTFHHAAFHPASPVLKPESEWEKKGEPTAMPFSDGVWFDPKDQLFKLWYMGGYLASTCLATSHDGITWKKQAFDVTPGTNVVQADTRDSTTVWLDQEDSDTSRRFKLWRSHHLGKSWGLTLHVSPDGVHWSKPLFDVGSPGDRSTVFYNPFRKMWVYSLRHGLGGRMRRYWETPDLLTGPMWKTSSEPVLWTGADTQDPMREDLKVAPELYNLDAVAYESLMLGLFTIWRGQPKDRAKPNEVCVGFSRDGFHWHRPDHGTFIPVSEHQGDWNWANVQSAGGCCLVVGDNLYFYVSGRAGVPGSTKSGVSSTGLAVLRRDGFASMDAGDSEGTLTTRPLTFKGTHLFVNASAFGGELRAEVLDEKGQVIAPFSKAHCQTLRVDQTRMAVAWDGGADLTSVVGRQLKLRFHLRHGALYSFWISPDASGASHGYVGAGGPGLTGPIDTVGGR